MIYHFEVFNREARFLGVEEIHHDDLFEFLSGVAAIGFLTRYIATEAVAL